MKKPAPDDVASLQSQLNEKNELVAALTLQLEKSATQLDRLRRSGADRPAQSSGTTAPGVPGELAGKLSAALEEWQELQAPSRIHHIESGIDQILELVKSLRESAIVPAAVTAPAKAKSNTDFWAAEKARILGEETAPVLQRSDLSHAERQASPPAVSHNGEPEESDSRQVTLESLYAAIGPAPEAPEPVSTIHDSDELLAAVKTRDIYIQYLTSRLRIAESSKLVPVKWELLEAAPDEFRSSLQALEALLKDHLRQAEISHSLERALLGRERAKLAMIKQNLEMQIKRMASISNPAPPPEAPLSAPEAKPDPESRWKRIFQR